MKRVNHLAREGCRDCTIPETGAAGGRFLRWLLLISLPLLLLAYAEFRFQRMNQKALENSQRIAQEVTQRQSLESSVFGLTDSSERLRQNISESDRVINQVLKSALEKNEKQVAGNRKLLERQEQRMDTLTHQLAEVERAHAESVGQWERSTQGCAQEIEKRSREIQDLKENFDTLQARLASQSSKLGRLREQLNQTDSLTAQVRTETLKDLRGLQEGISSETDRMKRDLVRIRSSLEDLRSELDRLRSNLANP